MSKDTEKIRRGFYLEKELLDCVDGMLAQANVRSRNEFVAEALRFYIGFLKAGEAEHYLIQSLSSVITGTMQDTENRIARMEFKMAVELSKLAHVIAYTQEVDEAALHKLHAKCVEEVRRIQGAVNFEEAYRYQNRGE